MAPMIMSTSTRVIEIPLAHRDTPPTSNGLSIFAMFRSKQALAHHQSHCCTCARAFSHIHAPAHAGIGTLSRLGVEPVVSQRYSNKLNWLGDIGSSEVCGRCESS